MSVPIMEDIDEIMRDDEEPEETLRGRNQIVAAFGIQALWNGTMEEGGLELCSQTMVEGRQIYKDILDLNVDLMEETDGMAILPYAAPATKNVVSPSQPLMLFGTEIMTSSTWPRNKEGKVD